MPTPFPNNMRFIQTGDPVAAGVVNSPLGTLDQRTRALQEQFNAATLGATLAVLDADIESSAVVPGMAVYRGSDGVFRPALAATELLNNLLVLSNSAYPWGVVSAKHSNVSGHVALSGLVVLTEDELIAASDTGDVITGLLFISATPGSAGKLTNLRPAIGIPVAVCSGPTGTDESGNPLYALHVAPGWRSPFEDHVHYKARLDTDVISASDNGSYLPGWQDVSEWELETGLTAPAGARFRYTVESDINLNAIWPPIPMEAVHYDLDGIGADTDTGNPVMVDDTGIFWTGSDNPDTYARHELWFTKMEFKTGTSVVTRLLPLDDSVVIQDSTGEPAEVGTLYIGAQLTIDDAVSTQYGSAVKAIDGLSAQIGPVVDGVRSATPGLLSVTGSGTPFVSGSVTYQCGLLALSVLTDDDRERPVTAIELDNVRVEVDDPVTFLALPSDGGSVTGRIEVPSIGISGNVDLTLTVDFWARASGNLPDIDVEAAVVAPLTTTPTATSPTLASVGTFDLPSGVTAEDAMRFSIELASAIAPGSLVYFRLTRAGSDGYSGDVGILALRWSIAAS